MVVNGPKQTSHLKREILVRLIKAFYTDDFAENARLIPYQMRPKDYEAAYIKNVQSLGIGQLLD